MSGRHTSDTQPLDLNSDALGIGRHVSGIPDPFDQSRIRRSDGWIEITWNNMSDPGDSPRQAPRSRKAASRHRLPPLVWLSA